METIQEHIQSFFDEGTVIIIGSGLSCAEGLPGMGSLAEELKDKISEIVSEEDKNIWQNIKTELDNETDLESTLLKIPPSESLEKQIKKVTYDYIYESDYGVYKDIIENNRKLRLTSLINKFQLETYPLNIITTNYDRLIEYSCESLEIQVDNMFFGKYLPKLDIKNSKESLDRIKNGRKISLSKVNLYKPHGCLNWKKINEALVYSQYKDIGDPHIITPGTNKYFNGYQTPFDINRELSNMCIDEAKRYIFIGYGFNDQHLETRLRAEKNLKKPILILTRSFTSSINELLEKNSHIMGVQYEEPGKSKVIWRDRNESVEGNYWDIKDLIEWVFLDVK